MQQGLREKYPLFLSEFNENWIFSIDLLQKIINIKFNENSSGGSTGVPCGRTDIQTDMTKLVIAFRNLEPLPGKTEFDDSIVRYKNSRLVGERNPRHSLRGSLHELIINNKAHNVRVLPYYRKTFCCAIRIAPCCFINQVNGVLNLMWFRPCIVVNMWK